jgi:hypothetical protein
MAIASELAAELASLADRPPAVAIHHLRNLRDAGLITKSGRGPSAAKMEIGDAVTLLFAMAGTERLKDSVITARSLAHLRAVSYAQIWHRKEYRIQRNIFPFGDKHSFADALHCVFGMSAIGLGIEVDNSDAIESMNTIRYLERTSPKLPRFSVEISYPTFGATLWIEVSGLVRETWQYGRPRRKADSEHEFTRFCRFGSPTFDAINKLLSQS